MLQRMLAIGDGGWRRGNPARRPSADVQAVAEVFHYETGGSFVIEVGFDSCWLRTLTALARHFQQRGESCTNPSLKLTVVHSAVRSHQTQVASGCHWDRVTSMR